MKMPIEEERLMERVWMVLRLAGENGLEAEAIDALPPEALSAQGIDPDMLREVRGFLQFLDEIPGSFLIYRASDDERIVFANRGLLRLFGCASIAELRALTGNSFRGIVHPDDLDAVEQSISRQIEGSDGRLDYVEYRIRRKDGTVRRVEDYGHLVHGRNTEDFFYVFLGDATEKYERRERERILLQSAAREKDREMQKLIQHYDAERALINQEYLRRLEVIEGLSINYESILFADLDADQVLPYRLSVRTQPMFETHLSLRAYSEYAAEYAQRWVHPEDRERVARMTSVGHIREALAQNSSFYFNYRVLMEDETQYLQLRVVAVGESEGRCSQIVLGFRSVDEEIRREMEQKQILAQALTNANLAVTAKNTFLSNMSHDLRTPLNAIIGFAQLAKNYAGDPKELLGYLDRIEASGRQLFELISKLLELANMESEESSVAEVECVLRDIAQDVYHYLRPQAQEKAIDFSMEIGRLRHETIFSDPEKLHQLLMYLANNAITYTPPEGRVTISIEEKEEKLGQYASYSIRVQDTGIGIGEEFLEQIFEPFSREKNTTLSGVHGAGLGLSIVKNIVDMMGGTIDVQSRPDEGSTFTVGLNFRVREDKAPTLRAKEADTPPVCGRNVLVVEDNEINMQIEKALLKMKGFSVDTAEDGSIALEKIRRAAPGQYDVILMDLQMPVMDGWQAAAEIRKLENPALASIPIIAVSANSLKEDVRHSMESGMNAHLPKPIDINEIVRQIEALVPGM